MSCRGAWPFRWSSRSLTRDEAWGAPWGIVGEFNLSERAYRRRLAESSQSGTGILGGLVVFGVLWGSWYTVFDGSDFFGLILDGTDRECRMLIERRLRAPDTVVYEQRAPSTLFGDDESWVYTLRAQNGFGGVVRAEWMCTVDRGERTAFPM